MNEMTCTAELVLGADPLPTGKYQPAYGLGKYDNKTVDCDWEDRVVMACRTKDGACQWWEISQGCHLLVKVVAGDPETIRQLVTAESEHFDCALVWRQGGAV